MSAKDIVFDRDGHLRNVYYGKRMENMEMLLKSIEREIEMMRVDLKTGNPDRCATMQSFICNISTYAWRLGTENEKLMAFAREYPDFIDEDMEALLKDGDCKSRRPFEICSGDIIEYGIEEFLRKNDFSMELWDSLWDSLVDAIVDAVNSIGYVYGGAEILASFGANREHEIAISIDDEEPGHHIDICKVVDGRPNWDECFQVYIDDDKDNRDTEE